MGCFSFICTECGEPINSDSFSGENVRLSLLQGGKVIEEMQGQYDSYGRVFSNEKDSDDRTATPTSSVEWKMDWGDVCNLMFEGSQQSGISAAHVACIQADYKPEKKSTDDPDQGWGKYDPRHTRKNVTHYHKVY